MPFLQAQDCLLQKATQHGLKHLWRGIPGGEPSLYHGPMAEYGELLLSIPRRIARGVALPSAAIFLVGLSPARGGLGYRSWKNTADCAFLASYISSSATFPSLFPDLAILFPPILSLVQRGAVSPPSSYAKFALRAFHRIDAGDSRYCRQAGQLPGFGAQWGAHEKNKKIAGPLDLSR